MRIVLEKTISSMMGFTKTDQEIVEEIQKCIKTGKKQKEPRYDEDKIY